MSGMATRSPTESLVAGAPAHGLNWAAMTQVLTYDLALTLPLMAALIIAIGLTAGKIFESRAVRRQGSKRVPAARAGAEGARKPAATRRDIEAIALAAYKATGAPLWGPDPARLVGDGDQPQPKV